MKAFGIALLPLILAVTGHALPSTSAEAVAELDATLGNVERTESSSATHPLAKRSQPGDFSVIKYPKPANHCNGNFLYGSTVNWGTRHCVDLVSDFYISSLRFDNANDSGNCIEWVVIPHHKSDCSDSDHYKGEVIHGSKNLNESPCVPIPKLPNGHHPGGVYVHCAKRHSF